MQDPFAILGIAKRFSIDEKELEEKYFLLQQQYHPDRFAGKPGVERTMSLNKSMEITNAYQALRSPLQRAQYLLAEQKIFVNGENDNIKPTEELLMEVMEIREQLSDVKDKIEMKALDDLTEAKRKKSTENLEKNFIAENFQAAAQDAIRLKYFSKIAAEIRLKAKIL